MEARARNGGLTMAIIPMGEFSQARAVPRPETRRIDTSATTRAGAAMADAGRALVGVGATLADIHDREVAEERALARAQASNALLDDEIETTQIVEGIQRQIAAGELDWREAAQSYADAQADRTVVPPKGLDAADIEQFGGGRRRVHQRGLLAVQQVVADARKVEFRAQFDAALDSLGKLAAQPGADMDMIHQRADFFAGWAGEAGVDAATVAAKVQTFKDRTWQDHARTRAIGARDNPAALAELERDLAAEDGFYAGRLDTDKRNVLLNQVLGRKDQVERALQEQALRSEAKADRALVEFEQQIATGVMAPLETMRAWQLRVEGGTPEQQDRFRELLDDEEELREVRRMPPAAQRHYIQSLRAQQQAGGATARQISNLQRMETVLEADLRRLREAPLEYDAILSGTPVQPLNMQALVSGDAEVIREQFSERMAALTRMRNQYGPEVGNVPLLPHEASLLSAALGQGGTRQAAQLFGTLNRAIGDPDAYDAAMQQLVPDSPVRAFAGRIYALQRAGGQPDGAVTRQSRHAEFGDVALYLLKGEALLNPGKEANAASGKSAGFPMPPPQHIERQISAQVRQAFAGRPEEYDVAVQAVRAYYAAKSADEGDMSGALHGKRLQQAIRAVIGQRVRFEGRDVLPPWGMPADQFRDRAEAYVQARLNAAGIEDPGDVSLMNMRGRDGGYMLVRGIEPIIDRRGLPLVIRIGASQ